MHILEYESEVTQNGILGGSNRRSLNDDELHFDKNVFFRRIYEKRTKIIKNFIQTYIVDNRILHPF